MKFVPPKYDECMKELFRNEEILKYFISDVLGIPVGEIQSVRLRNTFLWRRHRNQKLGILDVLAEMNGTIKINIEVQLKILSFWDRRQIFYLSKLYTENLYTGEDYARLKRCIGISVLDFNLTEGEEYHHIYCLRDQEGVSFSDALEIHTLELRKKLRGGDPVDDWIRFFNVEREEDLDMIRTKNAGILKAICELRRINMRRGIRLLYEAHLKDIRDQRAIEHYAQETARRTGFEQGIEEGIEQGIKQGIEQGEARMSHLIQLLMQNSRQDDIARAVNDREYQKRLFEEFGI